MCGVAFPGFAPRRSDSSTVRCVGWCREGWCMVCRPFRLRPAWALITRTPAPAREPCGGAGVVFVDGEGVPSPAPPRVISPRSGAWDDANEGRVLGRHPWQAFPGISRLLPPPTGRGRSAGGAGGVGERGEQCMECRRIMSGIIFPGFAPFPGSYHENLRSCAGALWEGRRGSLCRGGGSLPGPSPGDIPTVRCMG